MHVGDLREGLPLSRRQSCSLEHFTRRASTAIVADHLAEARFASQGLKLPGVRGHPPRRALQHEESVGIAQ